LPDFNALKTQLAKVNPKNTAMAQYQVTNTAAASCPATTGVWASSEKLPPVANAELCECMTKSVSCTVADGLEDEEIGELFGQVCGMLDGKACNGIARDPKAGTYGAYSMCTGRQQLAFALDQYYQLQKKASDACAFGGKAKIQQGSTAGSCSNLVKAAGTAGTGTVTALPGNAQGTGTAGTGSGTSPSGSGTGTGNAAAMTIPAFNTGLLAVVVYVLFAGMTGVGMILL
jgi:hypothetical protein